MNISSRFGLLDPCLNNGTCIDELADFRCLCQSGFTGKSCGIFNELLLNIQYIVNMITKIRQPRHSIIHMHGYTIQNYCRIHYADGTCDDQCNLAGCGYDGGDCDGPKKICKFLMTLSKKLRASVKIKNDKDGPMIYEWDGEEGNRITIPTGQVRDLILEVNYSGKIRLRRSTSQQGVIVWVQIDVSECRGDCFSNVNTVASYLGAANAKQDLAELGMPIYEAIARHPDIPSPNSTDSFFGMVILGLGLMIVVATVFVLQQRTRKRRMIEAPVWKIPTEAQSKLCSMSQNEQMLRNGFYHDLFGAKRSRHENMNYYQPDPFHESATPFQTERVEAVTVKKKLQPSANLLHEQAASDMPIELPIDTSLVNVRGPFGRTPLIFLADNTVKTEEQLIEDAQNLIDAGANANIQDDG
uniref:EGF-like domain-containing protein n=1 Tax=Heterorhabditis bacteriophora TaxID=37862 RepID=A0A1I7X3Q3_HETBA